MRRRVGSTFIADVAMARFITGSLLLVATAVWLIMAFVVPIYIVAAKELGFDYWAPPLIVATYTLFPTLLIIGNYWAWTGTLPGVHVAPRLIRWSLASIALPVFLIALFLLPFPF